MPLIRYNMHPAAHPIANPPPISSTILYGHGCYRIVILLINFNEKPQL